MLSRARITQPCYNTAAITLVHKGSVSEAEILELGVFLEIDKFKGRNRSE